MPRPTTGLDLKVLRIRVRPKLTMEELGSRMDPAVSGSRVSAIESSAYVSDDVMDRYLRALDGAVQERTARLGAA